MTTSKFFQLMRHKATALVSIMGLLLLMQGCGSSDEIQVKAGSCPLPPNVADEDRNTMKKFSGDVSGIITSVAGVSASGEIQGALEKYYPAAHDVNRIYALSYAACVACRLDPNDVKGCAQRFNEIIAANHAKREESARTSESYHQQVLGPIQGQTAGGK
ncbi:MAG: hypothetical protein EPO64_06985 [Nitrospirae bacterium]|nr:MAG: hypothetical protein EPO64_06985 [Nitrospirota bacterium]